ncbi:MAG: tRNA threonylcarbamoyladenosine biosynthesis protein [Elusimicrobia bacterium]|nr:MAG: tRNA threonylcarbamoyladenosine biosynthesis protein [Elusimicrobiota bacterium]KAF0154941.1 MAG: tRNA threonylcarbamoyladenosine biosynthesis protein [Elusimicrobiota bacterium]
MLKVAIMKALRPDARGLARAAAVIKRGGLAAFPTETVYGLGASAFDPAAAAGIFEAKGRPHFDPLIVHISGLRQLRSVAAEVPPAAALLARRFWPGPLTLVLKKRTSVPDIITSGLPTVAVRMPAHPVAVRLIKLTGPLAAPSANRFGALSPTTAEHVLRQLGPRGVIVIDGGPARHGIESTIVSFDRGRPVILRRGALPDAEIAAACGLRKVRLARPGARVRAPGQFRTHYAPSVPLKLIKPGAAAAPRGAAYLAFRRRPEGEFRRVEVLSQSGDLREAAANLFSALHRLEMSGAKVIYAERVPARGLGLGILDRLRRAAAR